MKKIPTQSEPTSRRLENLAEEIYAGLAAQFPTCLASDEFHFFPQYRASRPDWSRWDDFSDAGLRSLMSDLGQWKLRLEALRPSPPVPGADVDHALLLRALTTVDEQLRLARPHQSQPTFYLTIASIGMAEALADSHQALERRLGALPGFIRMARDNLQEVPLLFRDLGWKMIAKMRMWLDLLPLADDLRRPASRALDGFHRHLEGVQTPPNYRLAPSIYSRIAEKHMGCHMAIEEIAWHLDQEIEESAHRLAQAAARTAPGKPWVVALKALPLPAAETQDAAALYRGAIAKLKSHCLAHKFFDATVLDGCDVRVEAIPEHMTPVRANAAYSMPPGHPPRGGVFYVSGRALREAAPDALMLTAHETYPGHHLLDTLRWRLSKPMRRSLEFPLFYEGWASFSEEILFDTGFFSGPADQLLMAKRRFWRAQRGRADLNIHTGRATLAAAAADLGRHGMVTPQQALAMVQRYALKPGYQLSYAIGRRKFRQLYTAFLSQGRTPGQFVSQALSHGEIGFDHLAEILLYEGGHS